MQAEVKPRRAWPLVVVASVVLLAAVGPAGWRYARLRQVAADAGREYDRVCALYEVDRSTAEEVCDASAAWCAAEQATPLADPIRAQALHVVRLVGMETRLRAAIPATLFDRESAHAAAQQRLLDIARQRMAAQARLEQMLGR